MPKLEIQKVVLPYLSFQIAERLAKAKARERDRKGGQSPRAVRELSPIEVLC